MSREKCIIYEMKNVAHYPNFGIQLNRRWPLIILMKMWKSLIQVKSASVAGTLWFRFQNVVATLTLLCEDEVKVFISQAQNNNLRRSLVVIFNGGRGHKGCQ